MSGFDVPGDKVVVAAAAALATEASARLASALRAAIAARGVATLALSGGNTPRPTYSSLAHEPDVDWSRVRIFWVDERAVPPTDDRSNYRWAKATLLDGAHVPENQVHRMPAERADADVAAREYERLLVGGTSAAPDEVPQLDVVVLGIGDDGHTASLFPGDGAVDVRDRFVIAVPAAAKREARMTITAPVLQHARTAFVLAEGAGKRDALRRVSAADGDLHATPSRVLRASEGALVWILDQAADGG
jgi:6-phosphogluconolactonase